MNYKNVWSDLSDREKKYVVEQLEGGGDYKRLADVYGLNPESLARKWRYIRQNRRETPNEVEEQTPEKIDSTNVLPSDTMLADFDFGKYYGKVLGEPESMPCDRYMYIDTREPLSLLFVTDTHFGQHDEQACDTFLRVAEKVPHDILIHGGDALECHGLSRYGKDPNHIFKHSLKNERRYWYDFAEQLNNVSQAHKFIIDGNHVHRYFEWLRQNPSVMALEEFQLDNILYLEEFGYEPMVNSIYFDCTGSSDFPNPSLLFHHGSVSRKHSGSSSRIESENRGFINSISGHVHRLSVSYRRTMSGQIVSAEGGTLRTLQPDWMDFPDWAHGCLQIDYDPVDNYVGVNPILILNGKAYLNGKTI